jgi:hypothetical protein
MVGSSVVSVKTIPVEGLSPRGGALAQNGFVKISWIISVF